MGFEDQFKKYAAMAGIAGLALTQEMQVTAAEQVASNASTDKKAISKSSENFKPSNPSLFEIVCQEGNFSWGVEYVETKNKQGNDIFLQRYVKIDNTSGIHEVVGEYENVAEAAKGLRKLRDVPDSLIKYSEIPVKAIRTEREFQETGLVDPDSMSKIVTELE